MAGNLDKLEVTLHRQFRQKTKRLTLVGPTAGALGRSIYATDVFASEQMEIVKQPQRPDYRFGQKNRTRVQYTMCNAFAVVRMVELPGFTTNFGYEFGCTLSGVKGAINTFYPNTQVFTRNSPFGPLLLGANTFNSPVMRPLAEIAAPGMVEPYAVADYIYVSSQLAIEVLDADLPAVLPAQIFMIVDYEVRLTAAGLLMPPG
jgi:hypothetical protein